MESNSRFNFTASASKLHPSPFHSHYSQLPQDATLLGCRDLSFEYGEVDGGEEELKMEFACPFCLQVFDVVELCCHIDGEHPVESKNGVCSICAAPVGPDLVAHIIMQHGNFFKMQSKRRYHKGGAPATQSIFPMLKKDFHEGNIQPLAGGSTYMVPTTAEPDPFLSSLIYTSPDESLKDCQPESMGELSLVSSDENVVESRAAPSLSDNDQKELALRSAFVQGLMLSTIFSDPL